MTGTRPTGTAPFLPDHWWELPLERRRLIAGAVALGVVLLAVTLGWWAAGGDDGGTASSAEAASEPTEAEQFVADLPADRVATWDALAECETGGDWTADTGNGYSGGLQFSQSSWEVAGGVGSPAAAPREEQIMRAELLYREQGWTAWPSCSAQLGLA